MMEPRGQGVAGATSQEATASKGRGQSAPGFKKWSPTRPLITHCTAMSSANRKGKADGRAPRERREDTRDSGPAPPAQGTCGSPSFAGLESDAMALEDVKQNIMETEASYQRDTFDPEEEYKMDHGRRGIALIFNHNEFYWKLQLKPREGTYTDKERLTRRLKDLGFEVKCFDNLKAEEIQDEIDEVSTCSHVDADCFMCVFLSHGKDNHIYAYDAEIEIQTLTEKFKGDKCPSLVGKPKIFIIQACRGEEYDESVIPMDAVDSEIGGQDSNMTQVDAASVYTLPAGADFLMCYSVAEGYYSFRNTKNGSWYIQDLCEMLEKYGSSLEFTELLTLVNRKVSQRQVKSSDIPKAIGKKQVPCFASMLTKKLHFYPKASN